MGRRGLGVRHGRAIGCAAAPHSRLGPNVLLEPCRCCALAASPLSGPGPVVMPALVGAGCTRAGRALDLVFSAAMATTKRRSGPAIWKQGLLAARPDLELEPSCVPRQETWIKRLHRGPAWPVDGGGRQVSMSGQGQKRAPAWDGRLCRSKVVPGSQNPTAGGLMLSLPTEELYQRSGAPRWLQPCCPLSSGDCLSLPFDSRFSEADGGLARRRPNSRKEKWN